MTKLNKSYEGRLVSKIKSVTLDEETDDLIIEGYANTTSKDRSGDVIPMDTWKKAGALSNFLKNPIILAYHDHSNPVGKAIEHYIDEQGLRIKALISKGAGRVYDLVKDGILTTFSVGFYIKDAEYHSKTDTYLITELELLEVSVVSVPCNQDSTFSVSKSLSDSDAEAFKNELLPSNKKAENNESHKEETMPNSTEQNKPTLTMSDVEKLIADREAAAAAAKAAKDAKAAEAEQRIAEIKAASTAAAKELVEGLEAKMKESSDAFSAEMKEKQAIIEALETEVRQVVAAKSKSFNYNRVNEGMQGEARKTASDAVLLGLVTKQGTFGTKFGESIKAVNDSSSIEVSSEAYETVFSQDLIRDIQAELVIAPLFQDITMTSANLTIPVNPNRKNATWVESTSYGTDGSSGGEISNQLTEINLKTFKLAAKSFITDETSEDVIMPLLPLIRQHLVEAHANEIDRAFLLGTGSGQPKGLVIRATEAEGSSDSTGKAGGVEVSAATASGATPITAKMILKARKKMKLYGLKVRDVTLVVSTEAYYALVEDDAWADVNLVGGAATKLSGQVGSIYGMPVIVSDHFEAPGVSKVYAILVNTKNFIVPTQRNITVRTDFDVEKDRRVIVATQRLNLESLIRDTDNKDKGIVAVSYAGA